MESGEITDAQLSSSSQRGAFYGPSNARLNRVAGFSNSGGWSAFSNDANQWLQVNLLSQKEITGLRTQGRQDADEWVSKYRVQTSVDGVFWQYVTDANSQTQVRNNPRGHSTFWWVGMSGAECQNWGLRN